MTLPAVSVVLGSADYTKFAPANSYVDAAQFESPKDLANYLIFLSSDSVAYNSYFKWKEDHR